MMSQESGRLRSLPAQGVVGLGGPIEGPRVRVNVEADTAGVVTQVTGQDVEIVNGWKAFIGGKHLGLLEQKTDVDSPALWDRLRTGNSEEFEAVLGGRSWSVCLFPVLSAEGRVERVFGFAQSQADGLSNEAGQVGGFPLTEAAPDIVAILTEDCRIRQIGLSTQEILGVAADRLAGRDWLSLVHPSDASVFAAGLKMCIGNPAKPLLMELRLRHARGDWKRFRARAISMLSDASVRGIAVECAQAAKEEEAQGHARDQGLLQGILATTSDAICIVDKTQRILLANPRFHRYFVSKDGMVNGAPLASILQFQGFELFVSQTFREGYLFDVEAQDVQAGHKRVFLFSFMRLTSSDGDGAEVLIAARDLTQERVAQQQLLQAAHLASLGELTSGITHELNDTLAQITDGAGALLEVEAHPALKERVRQVHQHAENASRVLSRVISFARSARPARTPVNVAHEVRKVLDLRAYELRANRIEVINNLPASLPPVLADRVQIAQVFLNIIVNAEQAMLAAHDHGRLWITGHAIGAFVRLSFRDSGLGIREEHLAEIFEPFFTTKEPSTGSGLGLSISLRIVSGHGGRLYAVSEAGKGATFVVELPITDAHSSAPLH